MVCVLECVVGGNKNIDTLNKFIWSVLWRTQPASGLWPSHSPHNVLRITSIYFLYGAHVHERNKPWITEAFRRIEFSMVAHIP